MKDKLVQLGDIDWDFSDYKGGSSLSLNINSMHWYPAAFVPQIPAMLIQALTNKDDIVFDPFAGSGITLLEAARLKRRFVGVDVNPYAIDICKAKFYAISTCNEMWQKEMKSEIEDITKIDNLERYVREENIKEEVFLWFEKNTLSELLALHQNIRNEKKEINRLIKKVLFSSILLKSCSQREHYTYITDGCYPKKLSYSNAFELYKDQINETYLSTQDFRQQYKKIHNCEWNGMKGIIKNADSRNLKFIDDDSIDVIVTSPPYLGVNDYIRSMRLSWLFFFDNELDTAIKSEIGARRSRARKFAYEEYINDMGKIFSEIDRILKNSGFICMVIGQGRGRVCKKNTIVELIKILQENHKFKIEMRASRKIKFRRIQVPGVGTEEIIVFRK